MNSKNQFMYEYGHKLKVLGFAGGLTLVSFVFVKYVLPILWPFVIAFALALIIRPVVDFLRKYLHINKIVGTTLVVLALITIMVVIVSLLVKGILTQVKSLMENMDAYRAMADRYMCDICCSIGDSVGVEGMALFSSVSHNIDVFIGEMESKVSKLIMGTSIPAIVAVIDLIIGIALTIVSLYLIVKDRELIRNYINKSYFAKEFRFVIGRTMSTIKAYLKAQLIIMGIIAVECVTGLMLIGNKYALLIGIVIGVLDALPLFGVGAVLIPWTIIYIVMGRFLYAAVLFTIFIVCYFTREFLEPRLIGDKIGIHPLMTLIAIYAGYRLLGFVGMFVAPLIYILVRDATGIYIKKIDGEN